MSTILAIVGAGNMGAAILLGAVRAGVVAPDDVLVVDVDAEKRRRMSELGCDTSEDPAAAAGAEYMLLAVKPQIFPAVSEAIGILPDPRVVITIMAGLSSRSIRSSLGPRARVIRVMPNTPAQVGCGMTAIALGDGARPGDERFALGLFDAVGRTAIVDESLMHAVTAVSGSGPAYIFLLAEAMEQAAVEIGLDPVTAHQLVRQTVLGAGRLLETADETPGALRAAVTSPGGTTAAALDVLFESGWPGIVMKAVIAAHDRGVALDTRGG